MPSAGRQGGGAGGAPPYTAILPVREGRGTDHLDESVGSLLRLDPPPDELLLGVDEGSPQPLADRLSSICASCSYEGYALVRVPFSPRFGFQLAHVIWRCMLVAAHDRILVSNADTSVLQPTMRGLWEVGPDGPAFVSLTEKWKANTPVRLLRYAAYRRRVAKAAVAPYSGQFWSWRPAITDVLAETDFAGIHDGIDELVHGAVRRSGRYEVRTYKEVGSYVHGDTHYTVPWVQFKSGLYAGARAQARLAELRGGVVPAQSGSRRFMALPRPLRVPAARAAYRALAAWGAASTWAPHLWSGYRWAMRNPDHPAVRSAASMGQCEWIHTGAGHLAGVPVPGRKTAGDGEVGTGWD